MNHLPSHFREEVPLDRKLPGHGSQQTNYLSIPWPQDHQGSGTDPAGAPSPGQAVSFPLEERYTGVLICPLPEECCGQLWRRTGGSWYLSWRRGGPLLPWWNKFNHIWATTNGANLQSLTRGFPWFPLFIGKDLTIQYVAQYMGHDTIYHHILIHNVTYCIKKKTLFYWKCKGENTTCCVPAWSYW